MTEQMKFKMRFVGFKEDGSGELKPTSPGGFKRHEIRELPFECSLSIWWEIVDAIPDLVVPEPRYEDSVFIEEVFVPVDAVDIAPPLGDEDETPFIELKASEVTMSHSAEPVQSLTVKVDPEPAVDEILYKQMTVKELKTLLEKRGVKVDSQWRKADLIREARKLEEPLRATSVKEKIEHE